MGFRAEGFRHMLVAHHYETARQPLLQQLSEALNVSDL